MFINFWYQSLCSLLKNRAQYLPKSEISHGILLKHLVDKISPFRFSLNLVKFNFFFLISISPNINKVVFTKKVSNISAIIFRKRKMEDFQFSVLK